MRPWQTLRNLRFAKTFATVGIHGISAMRFSFRRARARPPPQDNAVQHRG
jgi:hypothetical protein